MTADEAIERNVRYLIQNAEEALKSAEILEGNFSIGVSRSHSLSSEMYLRNARAPDR